MRELDIWQNLIIRACKSNFPSREFLLDRLSKIWAKRCGIKIQESGSFKSALAHEMLFILEKKEIGLDKRAFLSILENMNPNSLYNKNDIPFQTLCYWSKVIISLAMIIRLTEIKQWEGFRRPLRSQTNKNK